MFIGKDAIVTRYVYDCVIFSKKGLDIPDKLIESLKRSHENFEFTDDGSLSSYLGVEITRHNNDSIELAQPHLMERFLVVIGIDGSTNSRKTPALKLLLYKYVNELTRKHIWNYRQAVGMLIYLQLVTRPDLSLASHQSARFYINPILSHEKSIYRIGKNIRLYRSDLAMVIFRSHFFLKF